MKPRRSMPSSGFSLIELLVVMAVLGVLATAAMPLAELTLQREREREMKQALWSIRAAIDSYKAAVDAGLIAREPLSSGYPPSLDSLVAGIPDLQVSGARRYFLRRIPRDPFAPASTPPSQTWGLRSYQSNPNRPEPGADVYDVYSRSERIGLNGVPLKEW